MCVLCVRACVCMCVICDSGAAEKDKRERRTHATAEGPKYKAFAQGKPHRSAFACPAIKLFSKSQRSCDCDSHVAPGTGMLFTPSAEVAEFLSPPT